MKRLIFGTLTACLFFAGQLLAAEGWLSDLDEGKTLAAEEGKYLLVDFTGSDWCGWCIKLDKEVFKHSSWQEYADENLVQVSLDFPRKKKQSEEEKARNQKWMKEFGVRGFPTIFLLDPAGEVVAQTGYQKGGAQNYIKHVSGLINEHKAKAEG